jgi:hypothetical protein
MLYIDHPVGVGYSVGNVVIENETQVADYLCRFLEAWLKVRSSFWNLLMYSISHHPLINNMEIAFLFFTIFHHI